MLLTACALIAGIVLYFYALLLYASLVVALGANHAFTLAHYRVIFTEGLKAIRDTLIIAGIAMPLGGLYGVLVGYLVDARVVSRTANDGDHVDDRLCAARDDRRHRLPDRIQRTADPDHRDRR
jgi:ABC-type Fe3+ transport system permease subunit